MDTLKIEKIDKNIIKYFKDIFECSSDQELSEILQCGRDTIARIGNGNGNGNGVSKTIHTFRIIYILLRMMSKNKLKKCVMMIKLLKKADS